MSDLVGSAVREASASPPARRVDAHARVSPDLVPLLGLAALGAILAFVRLGSKSLWIDEASTLAVAELPWRSFWEPVEREAANMGLYYVALRGWVAAFGDGVAAARSL
jgi:hypothetical protein